MSCSLESSYINGKTVATDMFSRHPLKFLEMESMGKVEDALWMCVVAHGGAAAAKEGKEIKVTANNKSKLVLTASSSFKAYKLPENQTSRFFLSATVKQEATMFIVNPPIMCYAGARYTQKQTIRIEETSNIFLVDWIASGQQQTTKEEDRKYTATSTTEIYEGENMIATEDTKITEGRVPSTTATIFIIGPSLLKYSASVVADISARRDSFKKQVNEQGSYAIRLLSQQQQQQQQEVIATASEVRVSREGAEEQMIGAIVKVTANTTQEIKKYLSKTFSECWIDMLGGDPYLL